MSKVNCNLLVELGIPLGEMVIGLLLLIFYRLKKKVKDKKGEGFYAFLGNNLVELIIAAIVVPEFGSAAIQAIIVTVEQGTEWLK